MISYLKVTASGRALLEAQIEDTHTHFSNLSEPLLNLQPDLGQWWRVLFRAYIGKVGQDVLWWGGTQDKIMAYHLPWDHTDHSEDQLLNPTELEYYCRKHQVWHKVYDTV